MMTQNPYYTTLPSRGRIFICGSDALPFLQGLITNDIETLNGILYACLLTPQGKFLHDFFIQESEGGFILDCEGGMRAQDLYERLNKYRLRSDIEISLDEGSVFVGNHDVGHSDTRHADLGNRSFEKPEGIEEKPFQVWDQQRIRLCVPDGSRDMTIEHSTLLECHIDKLNGVSFDKGCYVGQEITARMHYRGLTKKKLHAVQGDLPDMGETISIDGKVIGEMRSSCSDIGLALLKNDALEKLSTGPVQLLQGMKKAGST